MNVGLICDFREEGWFSMDLVADMLAENLRSINSVSERTICPAMRFRARRGHFADSRMALNADRLINRVFDYPRHLKDHRNLDLFHILDHSYAHLTHHLPPDRVVITCHDLDAFRCLYQPSVGLTSKLHR